MKTFLTTSLAAVALLPLCATSSPAATKAENFEQASAKVGENGYLLFIYADKWDKFSKDICERLMKSKRVLDAAGDSVILSVAMPQFAKLEDREAIAKRLGKLAPLDPNSKQLGVVDSIDSYPAIAVYGPGGRHTATICGPVMMRADAKEVAERIAFHINAMKHQNELVSQADREQGAAKARLLGLALQVEGASRPNVKGKISQADPKDETGVMRSFEFNPWQFTEKMLKYQVKGDGGKMRDATLDEILAELDAKLEEPGYTPEQRQVFCANAIGFIHRKGDVTKLGLMRKYAAKMKELAPESTLGMAADISLKVWAKGLTYENGWTPSSLPTDETPVQLNGELPIGDAGTYTVTFVYKGGNDALPTKGVRLYDGTKLVAEDMHEGNAGAPHNTRGNIYRLKVASEVKNPRLFIIFGCDRRLDSRGTISIRYDK
ncbi:MAG TPA: hypothetical protein H9862_05310 [Candidatus Akkermansia intestinigallinarum]|uniref:Thioredoxin domain-containing protein n=1 Tax=Candidatus Akkermansia intestinigallinarum TaxID=2838431 RepID=A0A9D1VBC7_9BACT|nr:hypothetical protein [Candidatus Akkermansia intestinigallinarum]